MVFPKISNVQLLKRLEPPQGIIHMVLDTDTYNEIDDQFALAYALRSPEKIRLEAIYAAPFHNDRSTSPEDGMEKSYQEILNVLSILNISSEKIVYRGSKGFLKDENTPQESQAARDLVKRAMEDRDEPLYVVAIGAITNVASAILLEPKIIEKIVLIWLGGHAFFWQDTKEFNLQQDVYASRLVFNCGVPLVHIPCMGVTTHFVTTIPELECYLMGKSEIGTYLTEIVKGYTNQPFGWSKVIWDVTAIAWLINPDWVPTSIVHSPILTDQVTWSFDTTRHFIRSATYIRRDPIFADLFRKLT
ncbi:MAG: nucleoside hydrolase [Clostridiaceae bacterium]|nr:nucleoside hydrolase [Clostridiaceae bacterium]